MKFKAKLDEGAYLPVSAFDTDAGYDIFSPVDATVKGFGSVVIDTGVHIMIPKGYCGVLMSKSGLNVKHDLTGEGLVDSGYSGSIVVKLYNSGAYSHEFRKGDKLIQIVFIKHKKPKLVLGEMKKTKRGNHGFGSTGV